MKPTIEELETTLNLFKNAVKILDVKSDKPAVLSLNDCNAVCFALTQAIAIEKGESEPPRGDAGEALEELEVLYGQALEFHSIGTTNSYNIIKAALKQPAQAQGVDLFEKCPRCNGDGSYGVPDKYGEPIPQQCEHCFAIGYVPHIATQTTQEE